MSTTNDPEGEYKTKAEENAMDRIRSVAKEAASKVDEMMVDKAKREQLLGDLCEEAGLDRRFSYRRACEAGIKYMEAKIASGEEVQRYRDGIHKLMSSLEALRNARTDLEPAAPLVDSCWFVVRELGIEPTHEREA